jgi:metal-responsive CopG/Arc/MetJ family transcriptional regulator
MPAMKTIQIVIDGPTLAAADRAARRSHVNRSQLVRDAVRQYLATTTVRDAEAADRAGYERTPATGASLDAWDAVQSWPAD